MKIKTLVILAIIASMYVTSEAQLQKYCGRRLAMAMALVCDESSMLEKRSLDYMNSASDSEDYMNLANDSEIYEDQVEKRCPHEDDMDEYAFSVAEYDYEWPLITPREAKRMGRGKRQIVSECCDKPCSVDELKTYC
ncbi:jg17267 [Pararge aegeria aegeria]|uniref:Jg17267 protein n=2 Tax=Pararge aegeria TaxID=116150 RepID=A0A8S4RJI9_9NEOP|nr:jg17267 [Pararge aegeria aegeria]